MLKTYGHHKSFAAYEPVNEPWGNTPYEVLSAFYRQTREQVRELTPDAYFTFQIAFRYEPEYWNNLFEDTDKIAMDMHYY